MDAFSLKKEVVLSNEEFTLLNNYIYEQTGIQFSESKMYLLNNRLNKRLMETGSATFKDYYYYLKYDNSGKEFTNLLNVITTNETSFFRTDFQLDAFIGYIIPSIMEKKKKTGDRRILIWSAGCSTGEEPYTLAIMLMEKNIHLSYEIEIYANDVSDKVLTVARSGLYNQLSLRNTPPVIIQKYFNRVDASTFQIKPDVKRMVKFQFGNLARPNTLMLVKDRDVIFCRNVMIYFGNESRINTVSMFYDKLVDQGYLMVGHSETLHGISTAFKIVHYQKSIFYQKVK
ncbi:MAG: protein-glutamate O-methyltransferase CheR [Candidatus Delongbacteria bacterium]|nr:protein-glutamate O-methyltransferase CheR [Candidatus Delongbacteria bacterium]